MNNWITKKKFFPFRLPQIKLLATSLLSRTKCQIWSCKLIKSEMEICLTTTTSWIEQWLAHKLWFIRATSAHTSLKAAEMMPPPTQTFNANWYPASLFLSPSASGSLTQREVICVSPLDFLVWKLENSALSSSCGFCDSRGASVILFAYSPLVPHATELFVIH